MRQVPPPGRADAERHNEMRDLFRRAEVARERANEARLLAWETRHRVEVRRGELRTFSLGPTLRGRRSL